MTGFNLVDEPWIPCLTASGATERLSLHAVFDRGHELRDLATSAPSERVALLRFLIAVHQAALRGPATGPELAALLDRGRFDAAVGDYLVRWRDRFELFDRERPFMQPEVLDGVEPATIATLLPEWSSGNNTTLVDHHRDERPPALSPADAARALLVAQAYQLGGGVSKPFNRTAAPLASGLVGLLAGRTLFDTVVINGPPYAPEYRLPIPARGEDRPAWERSDARRPHKDGTTPAGWLDLLTWCPRAIRLLRDDDGAVRRCVVHQHLRLAEGVHDPQIPLRLARDGSLVRVKPQLGKALWRQADTILLGLGGGAFSRPGSVFHTVPELLEDDRILAIEVAGVVGSQGKIDDWAYARFPVGSRLATDVNVLDWMTGALERSHQVAVRAVQYALRKEGSSDLLFAGWERLYWGDVGVRFDALLREALDGASLPALGQQWNDVLRAAARDAVELAFTASVLSPAEHKLEADAHRKLNGSLRKLLQTTEQEAA